MPAARHENALTRKLGPLPAWGWVAIAAAAVLVWAWWQNRKGSKSKGKSSGSGASSASLQGPYVIQTTPPDQTINVGQDDDDDKKKHTHRRHHPRAHARVSVPNVIGEEYPAGAAKVKGAGLTAQRSSPFVGKVTRESPSAGTKVRKGSVVTLSGKPWPQSQQGPGENPPPPVQHSGPGGKKPRGSR